MNIAYEFGKYAAMGGELEKEAGGLDWVLKAPGVAANVAKWAWRLGRKPIAQAARGAAKAAPAVKALLPAAAKAPGFFARHPRTSKVLGGTASLAGTVGMFKGMDALMAPSEAEQRAAEAARNKNFGEESGINQLSQRLAAHAAGGVAPPPAKKKPPIDVLSSMFKNRAMGEGGAKWNPGLGAVGAVGGAALGSAMDINPIVTALLLGGAGAFAGPHMNFGGKKT